MFKELADRAFRGAFLEENLKIGLAMQIRAIREKRGLSQPKLAALMRKTQSVISRLEDPEYGKFTLRTLIDLARAFDVGLLVKFVPYSRLAAELKDVSPEALAVKSYDDELRSVNELVVKAFSAAAPSADANKPASGGALALVAQAPSKNIFDVFAPRDYTPIHRRTTFAGELRA